MAKFKHGECLLNTVVSVRGPHGKRGISNMKWQCCVASSESTANKWRCMDGPEKVPFSPRRTVQAGKQLAIDSYSVDIIAG